MKRLRSCDSLGASMSICPAITPDGQSPRTNNSNNQMNSREFESMLDGLDNEEDCVEELGGHILLGERKRRLGVDQVKALEKNFVVENKLEPERKVKLAQELGLQPRQVAVWFQNRRARWKTKQLERDYDALKANYDSLKLNFGALQHDNGALLKEIRELKVKLNEENTKSNSSAKGDVFPPESDEKVIVSDHDHDQQQPLILGMINAAISGTEDDLNYESFNGNNEGFGASLLTDNLKNGSSADSDSSAILNEDDNAHNQNPEENSIHLAKTTFFDTQLVENTEEHDFFGSHEEACDHFFSDEQAPTLHWYCPDQWNYETT